MYRSFSGYCPTQDKKTTIDINYKDASDTQSRIFIRGLISCDYVKRGGDCSLPKGCPIRASAPEELRG